MKAPSYETASRWAHGCNIAAMALTLVWLVLWIVGFGASLHGWRPSPAESFLFALGWMPPQLANMVVSGVMLRWSVKRSDASFRVMDDAMRLHRARLEAYAEAQVPQPNGEQPRVH